jgi:leucyl aminopeptidase
VKFAVENAEINSAGADGVVVGVYSSDSNNAVSDGGVSGWLKEMLGELFHTGEVKGKIYDLHVVHTLGRIPARLALAAGMGKAAEFNCEKLAHLMGEAVRALRKHRCKSAAIYVPEDTWGLHPQEAGRAVAEGCLLGAYQYKKHRTAEDDGTELEKVTLVIGKEQEEAGIEKGLVVGGAIARAAMMARDMVNEPANHMTPTHLAHIARECAEKHGLHIMVLDREQMHEEKMGALLGVAQGSSQPPKFIVIEYKGHESKPDTVGFVGKGLTFDSGGISLKPQEFMSDMKGDMAGAAAVIAAICAVAELKLKVNVSAIIPATENLPGGRALKPGDVLRASNGKSIEVVNTDAEGRLILADALSYAVRHGISPLVDLATLTGACHVALGDSYAGIFTNSQPLADSVLKAGSEAGEKLWQLPLPEEYKELNKSDVADIKNSGGRYGGAITAALFLQEFVGETPWVHVDIAGPFMTEKTRGLLVKGATGFGVRTLVQLASLMSAV